MPKQIKLFWRQMYGCGSIGHSASTKVDYDLASANFAGRRLRNLYSPECGTYASQKFRCTEWFCDKIVGSGIQCGKLVALRNPNSEHDNRDVRVASDRSADSQSAHSRHIDIEHNQIWTELTYPFEGLLPRFGLVYLVATARQGRAHKSTDFRLVIDDEDTTCTQALTSCRMTGKIIRNIVRPGQLETVNSPLWDCTML